MILIVQEIPAQSRRVPQIRISNRRACRIALLVAMLVFVVTYLRLTFALYDHFAYMTFDMGIFDQAVWLISQGQTPFVTTRGLHILGDHFSVLLYLIAPLYRLSPSPKTLLTLQTIAMTLGVIPAYGLARKRLGREAYGLLFGLLYLLHPAHQWSITYQFHPDTFATPLLVTALYALEAKRWRLYAVSLLLTALTKESAGIAIACVGASALLKRPVKDLKCGIGTIGFGVGMCVVSLYTVKYFNNGQSSPYFAIFRQYGSTPALMLQYLMHRPLSFLANLLQPGNLFYLCLLLLPFCFLPLLAPKSILLALPMLLINFMGQRMGMHNIEEYYSAYITPFLWLGAVIGFGKMQHWGWFWRWTAQLNLPIWALSGILLGPLPRPVDAIYAGQPPAVAWNECRKAITLVPPHCSVSMQMALGPHCSHRREIYTFPNPFVPIVYGGTRQALDEIDETTGAHLPNHVFSSAQTLKTPTNVEYIVLCPRSVTFPLSEQTYHQMVVGMLQNGNYETRYVGKYVMILQRTFPQKARLNLLALRTGRPTRTPKQIDVAYWRWLEAQYTPNGDTQ